MPVYCLLVGSHFHPPAKAIIPALNPGAPLMLSPEPDNRYDAQAVRVLWLPCQEDLIDDDEVAGELEENLAGFGRTVEELLDEAEPIMLGHIGKDSNKEVIRCRATGVATLHSMGLAMASSVARLHFGPDGETMVEVSSEGEAQTADGGKLIA